MSSGIVKTCKSNSITKSQFTGAKARPSSVGAQTASKAAGEKRDGGYSRLMATGKKETTAFQMGS